MAPSVQSVKVHRLRLRSKKMFVDPRRWSKFRLVASRWFAAPCEEELSRPPSVSTVNHDAPTDRCRRNEKWKYEIYIALRSNWVIAMVP